MGPPFENGGGETLGSAVAVVRAMLQWGRRSKTAEGPCASFPPAVATGASMGPPFENGGGRQAGRQEGRQEGRSASMGPPFENGGGFFGKKTVEEVEELQWGRRSKTAEGAQAAFDVAKAGIASMGPPFENGGGC